MQGGKGGWDVENRERRQVQSRETRALGCAIVRAVFLAFDTYTRPVQARFIRSRAMNHREAMLETLVEDTGTRLRKAQAGG